MLNSVKYLETLILVLNLKVTKKHFMHVHSKKKQKKKAMIFLGGINKIFIYLPYDHGINVKIIRIYALSKRSNREV